MNDSRNKINYEGHYKNNSFASNNYTLTENNKNNDTDNRFILIKDSKTKKNIYIKKKERKKRNELNIKLFNSLKNNFIGIKLPNKKILKNENYSKNNNRNRNQRNNELRTSKTQIESHDHDKDSSIIKMPKIKKIKEISYYTILHMVILK